MDPDEDEIEDGGKKSLNKEPKKAKYWDPARPLTISSTGWMVGERVRARNKAFQNSEMVLRSGFVPPSSEEYDYYVSMGREQLFWQKLAEVLEHRDGIFDAESAKEWFDENVIREKIGTISYEFATQAPGAEDDVDNYNDKTVLVEVVTLSGPLSKDSSVIVEANRDELIGNTMTPRSALELFEWAGSPLNNWHRRRLFFMLTYWFLVRSPTPETAPEIPALDLRVIGKPVIFDRVSQLDSSGKQAAVFVSEGPNDRLFVVPTARSTEPARFSTVPERAKLYEQLGGRSIRAGWSAVESFTAMAAVIEHKLQTTSLLSFFKSLLQKIVRLAPLGVVMDTSPDAFALANVPARDALIAVCVSALPQSTFNPNGGGRETGVQALFKRAMIICYEDGWPGEKIDAGGVLQPTEGVLAWATGMVVYAKTREWAPTVAMLKPVVNALLAALESGTVWTFSPVCGRSLPASTLPPGGNASSGWRARMLTAHLLRTMVFGMSGDIAMLRHQVVAPGDNDHVKDIKLENQARRYAKLDIATHRTRVVRKMPLWHAYDQHATPSLVFMFPLGGQGHKLISKGSASKPYGALFDSVFTLVTGRNTRRFQHRVVERPEQLLDDIADADKRAFVAECVRVQQEFHLYQRLPPIVMPVKGATRSATLEYPDAWLAYGVSSNEFKWRTTSGTKTTWLWTLSTVDPTDVHVARSNSVRSSLTKSEGDGSSIPDQASDASDQARRDLEERDLEEVRAEVYRMLAVGVDIPIGRLPLHQRVEGGSRQRYRVRYVAPQNGDDGGYFTLDISGKGIKWQDFRRGIEIQFPSTQTWTVPQQASDINKRAFLTPSFGLSGNARTVLSTVVEHARSMGTSESGIRMALARLVSQQNTIEFTTPGRDGGAAREKDLAPSAVQFEACQFVKLVAGVSQDIVQTTGVPQKFVSVGPSMFLRTWAAKQMSNAALSLPSLDPLEFSRVATEQVETLAQTFASLAREPGSYFATKLLPGQPAALQDHQRTVLDELAVRVARQRILHHFVRLAVGAGKTTIALLYFRLLSVLMGSDSVFCLFATTSEALNKVVEDSRALGYQTVVLNRPAEVVDFVNQMPQRLGAPSAAFVTHTTLKNETTMQAMQHVIGRAVLVMDEVHKTMGGGTQIGERMYQLAEQALSSLAMTATPLRNTRERMALRRWVQLGVQFPCMETAAFNVAINSIVTAPVRLKIPTVAYNYDLLLPDEWASVYGDDSVEAFNETRRIVLSTLPERMGGTSESRSFNVAGLERAFQAAYVATDTAIANFVVAHLARGYDAQTDVYTVRPFVLARDKKHAGLLADSIRLLLAKQMEITASTAVWSPPQQGSWQQPAFGATQFPDLAAPNVPLVAVMPQRHNTGYEATHFNFVVGAVYPSNQADREQIVGRVARFGQRTAPIQVHRFSAGITTLMLRNHIYAANLNKMIAELNRAQ